MTEPLRVLALNCTLKKGPALSNTGELMDQVIAALPYEKPEDIHHETIRIIDRNVLPGVGLDEGEGDDWPEIGAKMKEADILILGTPIWWNYPSSLCQRVLERMDAFDEIHRKGGKNPLANKVAGVVVTGHEDGGMSCVARIIMTLSYMGFTIPPDSGVYWIGEVGQPMEDDRAQRLANKSVWDNTAVLARNLVHLARLLKANPMPEGE